MRTFLRHLWFTVALLATLGAEVIDHVAHQAGYEVWQTGAPGISGTCGPTAADHGGGGLGQITATATSGACTIVLTFPTDNAFGTFGFVCTLVDETTPVNVFHQTAHTGHTCTLTGATASADVLLYTAAAF